MNGRKAKRLRKHSKQLLIRWIRSMTPDGEDETEINEKNLEQFLPEQTHIFANNKFMVKLLIHLDGFIKGKEKS